MLDRSATVAAAIAAHERARALDQAIARRLRQARDAAGLSQERLGAELGVTFQQVQKYEKGTNRISPGRLAVAAALLGRDIAWFFDEPATAARDFVLHRDFAFVRDDGGTSPYVDEAQRVTRVAAFAAVRADPSLAAARAADFAGTEWQSRVALVRELDRLRAGDTHGR